MSDDHATAPSDYSIAITMEDVISNLEKMGLPPSMRNLLNAQGLMGCQFTLWLPDRYSKNLEDPKLDGAADFLRELIKDAMGTWLSCIVCALSISKSQMIRDCGHVSAVKMNEMLRGSINKGGEE